MTICFSWLVNLLESLNYTSSSSPTASLSSPTTSSCLAKRRQNTCLSCRILMNNKLDGMIRFMTVQEAPLSPMTAMARESVEVLHNAYTRHWLIGDITGRLSVHRPMALLERPDSIHGIVVSSSLALSLALGLCGVSGGADGGCGGSLGQFELLLLRIYTAAAVEGASDFLSLVDSLRCSGSTREVSQVFVLNNMNLCSTARIKIDQQVKRSVVSVITCFYLIHYNHYPIVVVIVLLPPHVRNYVTHVSYENAQSCLEIRIWPKRVDERSLLSGRYPIF